MRIRFSPEKYGPITQGLRKRLLIRLVPTQNIGNNAGMERINKSASDRFSKDL
jgi:hypothetical protein